MCTFEGFSVATSTLCRLKFPFVLILLPNLWNIFRNKAFKINITIQGDRKRKQVHHITTQCSDIVLPIWII